jgi:hypothetical protein
MKRSVLALLALVLFVSPALAADKVPWTHSAEEFYLDGLAHRDGTTSKTIVTINFGWQHYISENVEVGLSLGALYGPADGLLAGPAVSYNFIKFGCASTGPYCRGNLVFGGDAALATGAVTDQAAGQIASWFGAKIYQGRSAAITLLAQKARAINPGPAGADGNTALDSTAALVRLSFGVPQPTTATPAP